MVFTRIVSGQHGYGKDDEQDQKIHGGYSETLPPAGPLQSQDSEESQNNVARSIELRPNIDKPDSPLGFNVMPCDLWSKIVNSNSTLLSIDLFILYHLFFCWLLTHPLCVSYFIVVI